MNIASFLRFGLVFFLLLLSNTLKAENLSPLAYLTAMQNAHKTLNYELIYLLQQDDEITSLRLRHAQKDQKSYAQLLKLDGSRSEIIQRDNIISYLGYDFRPFSFLGTQIIDDLPNILSANLKQIEPYYNFIDVGRTRIADRIARTIRIVPKDNYRYQYTVWIDEENFLLLQSELASKNNQRLEQFRVLQAYVDEQMLYIVEPISTLILPNVLKLNPKQSPTPRWKLKWLPNGFKAISKIPSKLTLQNEQIESQMFSDGLFSFTLYIAENQGLIFNEQFWRQDKLTVYSQTIGNKDVIVVGELPLVSAKYLVEQLEFTEEAIK